MISVKSADARPKSSFHLTTVYSDMDTTLAELIQSRFSEDVQLLPKREVIPPSMSPQEYTHLITDMMEESKTVAKIVALRHLGYDVKATGEGARVERLLPGTMAEGILAEGDVVVAADGQSIETANDLVNLVRRKEPGSKVSLTVQRAGDTFRAEVGTKESDTEPGIAVIGILIRTHLFGHNLPVQIDIDAENIGGPSAGLMFTLGIIDALREKGLAVGHKVAGTGTISMNGEVGPVGGIAQKVIGAERAGAEYFLAPGANLEAAKRAARSIRVVRVDKIDDAIEFLDSLKPSADGHRAPLLLPWRAVPEVPAA